MASARMRQLMEQLNSGLLSLVRWAVAGRPGMDPTTFTKNRERLQAGEVFEKFMTRLLNHPQVKPLLSDEHLSVDGTLIEAWASQRSCRRKDGSNEDGSDFHGQTRKNDTHPSTTDSDSRLYRKAAGREVKHGHYGEPSRAGRGRDAQQGDQHGRAPYVRGDACDPTQARRPPVTWRSRVLPRSRRM